MHINKMIFMLGATLTLASNPILATAQTPYTPYTIDVNDPKWAHSDNNTSWELNDRICLEGNFYKIGFNRGLKGKKRERGFEKIQKKCSKVDVPIDATAYFAGWDKGVASHCSFKRGYDSGRKSFGGKAKKICTSEIYESYHKGVAIGREHSQINNEARQLKRDRDKFAKIIALLEDDIRKGTNTAKISGDKLDNLREAERDYYEVDIALEAFMSEHDEVFNPEPWIETNYPEDLPKHWRDLK